MMLKRMFAKLGFYSLEKDAMRKYEADHLYASKSPTFGPMPAFFEEKARIAREYEASRTALAPGRLADRYNAPKQGASGDFPRRDDSSMTRACDTTAVALATQSSVMSAINLIMS
jgi:hypothetical protein